MSAKSIIEKLNRKEDISTISDDILIKNITELSKEPGFYSLPFEKISNIVKKVDTDAVKEPISLLRTLIEKTSEFHDKEAVLLLNDIKIGNLPQLTINDIISIVSKFIKCELLTKLGELYSEEKNSVEPDYEYIIDEQKRALEQKNDEIENIKGRLKEFEEHNSTANDNNSENPNNSGDNIFDACTKGDLTRIRYLYEVLHVNKEETCERALPYHNYKTRGLNALHIATINGHFPIVQYLCEVQKFDPQLPMKEYPRDTPLHTACEYGFIDIVQYLCEVHKVNAEATNERGWTPLHSCASTGNFQIVKYLCEVCNVNTEVRNNDYWTPLILTCSCGHAETAQYLIETAKVNKDERDNDGNSVLHIAVSRGFMDTVKYLCEGAKVNIEAANKYGETPLHAACKIDYVPIVQYLCEVAKANTKALTADRKTPYKIAKIYKRRLVARYLKSIGAKKWFE